MVAKKGCVCVCLCVCVCVFRPWQAQRLYSILLESMTRIVGFGVACKQIFDQSQRREHSIIHDILGELVDRSLMLRGFFSPTYI